MTIRSPIATRPTFEAPREWKWTPLTAVARLESGHTPSRRVPAYWDDGDVPWLSLKDIRRLAGKYVIDTADKPTALGIKNSSARVLPKGTVAFCRTASVGKVAVLGRDMATSQDFVNWVCGEDLLPEYLFWAFRSSERTFEVEKQGSTHQTIYMPTVKRFQVLLPPLAEQRRIAEILNKADALRAKRRDALAQLDTLTQFIFLDMFGDPVVNPRGWRKVPLKDAVTGKYGIKAGPFGSALKKEDYVASGYRVYGQEQVIAGRFDIGDYYINARKFERLKSCQVSEGDLLVSLVGSYGKILIVPAGIEPGIINPRLVKITPHPEMLLPGFLSSLLQCSPVQQELHRAAHGGTMGLLNAGILKHLKVIVPPLTMQQRWINCASVLEMLKKTHLYSSEELDLLFASVQFRAFRGVL